MAVTRVDVLGKEEGVRKEEGRRGEYEGVRKEEGRREERK